ncbi:hypothetical protein ABZ915_32115 [Streptomyces sp. NPDC046915]|uniref:hypothetical protein n=1 Tax=Streptomyces sp. NPDC046915 TaxID=3155257 RepID=UPI00340480F4
MPEGRMPEGRMPADAMSPESELESVAQTLRVHSSAIDTIRRQPAATEGLTPYA